jgi:fumarylacetoacetase
MTKSWIEILPDSDFTIENIPFGIIQVSEQISPATRIGDTVVDLSVLADFGFFDDLGIPDLGVFYQPVLNDFIALGRQKTGTVRKRLQELFSEQNNLLKEQEEICKMALHPASRVLNLMPVAIGDYTDFYSSIDHATNVGKMFRDPANALLPNWKHLPVGYHGRSSSIVISGTSIHRPNGQTRPDDALPPVFGPSKQLDFELEIAFITCGETDLGNSICVEDAENHIFGLVLFNDLSARDIQKWEYVPLGPFLSKNFGSVISPWIVTMDALEPFRIESPVQDPEPLPYLKHQGKNHFDLQLEVYLQARNQPQHKICHSNTKYLYWSMAQQLAHQTVNGCNVRTGDLYASGTISGPDPCSFGSMLELCWKGTKPITMPDGSIRVFVNDYDTVIMKAYGVKDDIRIGFGECTTTILPAKTT